MQLSYVDIIYAHRPDPATPMEETVRAFTHLIDTGKAFYWGTSEWSAAQIMEAHMVARDRSLIAPIVEQPEYNMFTRKRVEHEYHYLYDTIGCGLTTWSPLAYGVLTGKYNEGVPKDSRLAADSEMANRLRQQSLEGEKGRDKIAKTRALVPIAQELECTLVQLAIGWCTSNKHVSSVITGASRPEQVVENMKAVDVAKKLTPEVIARIEAIIQSKPEAQPNYR
eukprot:TRINITY_DN2807_c0_g1_i2.p1 TRINITY_DN2807_c0_g1~~TRINITY_DN2807_c0_g1_i2.p1  ORF type:complete len:224 (-),score=55.43 TRINITY_DN2807_c0_g1_i2:77-748(-)